MVDIATYRQLHPDSPKFKKTNPQQKRDRKEMDPQMMKLDEPPPSPDRLVFPSTIIGYNLRQKKWSK